MATAKKEKTTTKKKADPFKTKKSRTEVARDNETVTPPAEIATAIDEFRDAQEQAKHYEGEATVHKDKIMAWAQAEYTRRAQSGLPKSFKIIGDETMVTYIVQDSSAGLTDEDLAAFSERWGEDAAEDLITRDFRSIRFDPAVLEANYDLVVEALQSLPDDIVENLFKPMLMMARSGALEKAKKYAKSPEELQELMNDLKIKHYVK